ncbi:MAG: hypothetical protein Q7U53_17300 [Anaerolineaceae bacterium]|nr:hypothetical protein [Anaerolineaceae bacterium]
MFSSHRDLEKHHLRHLSAGRRDNAPKLQQFALLPEPQRECGSGKQRLQAAFVLFKNETILYRVILSVVVRGQPFPVPFFQFFRNQKSNRSFLGGSRGKGCLHRFFLNMCLVGQSPLGT